MLPATARTLLAAGCLLLLRPWLMARATAPDAHDPLALLKTELVAATAAAGQPRLFHQNLPEQRPLADANPRWNWFSYDYNVFQQPATTDSFLGLRTSDAGNLPHGVLALDVTWKPLRRVTAEMMHWLFGNLHRNALSTFDGKIWPMYTILHPNDHIRFLASPPDKPVAKGSTFTFQENPNSHCTHQPLSFEQPWVCLPNRKGFTLASPLQEWALAPATNATLVVERLTPGSCFWHKERELPGFGRRTVVTSKLWWEDGPDGLVLHGQRLAGVMAPGSIDEFETQPAQLLGAANAVVRTAYLDAAPAFADNVTSATYWFALHWAQEWTGLRDWLPEAYAARDRVPQ